MASKVTHIYDMSQYVSETSSGYVDHLISPCLAELKALAPSQYLNINNPIIDTIAWEVFGDERLWWVVCLYNDILDPMEPGTRVISLPLKSDIDEVLLKYRS